LQNSRGCLLSLVTLGNFGTHYLNAQAYAELSSPAAVEMVFDRGRSGVGNERARV